MTQRLEEAMAAFAPALPLAVGLSGGADSTALLLACVQRWPGQVQAVHIHHGLQAAAADFERHCTALCARLDVPLAVLRVQAHPAPGESPEDAARKARYQAFEALALTGQALTATKIIAKNIAQAITSTPFKSIALAQHADDQVETLLLALSRGAGPAGLAAMPMQWQRAAMVGIDWHRPLLRVPGAALRAWLQAQGQGWIEDPSNQELRYTRNRIRAQLLPALEAVFPQFRDTFTRSSAHAAQAQVLLHEIAQGDLQAVGQPPRIAALQALSAARQANVLRHWLRSGHATTPSAAQLAQLQQQIMACRTRGHRLNLKVGRGWVLRAGDCLAFVAPPAIPPAAPF